MGKEIPLPPSITQPFAATIDYPDARSSAPDGQPGATVQEDRCNKSPALANKQPAWIMQWGFPSSVQHRTLLPVGNQELAFAHAGGEGRWNFRTNNNNAKKKRIRKIVFE
ncbi:hypothetical protein JTE90_021934 [Oedothorax gibbosus]|uniref:Uncharacterized protein n=1 Tax=Oedothorax gibbosus TaxID=931172 RepID=A0AAV6VUD5_9ARAC|nr:hypothetical protein JTE90_021934 [Oedothorax gibbosus]